MAMAMASLERLSPREYDVARCYASGTTHRAIAEWLHISPATVRNHLAAVYRKLRVTSKTQLWQVLENLPATVLPPADEP